MYSGSDAGVAAEEGHWKIEEMRNGKCGRACQILRRRPHGSVYALLHTLIWT